MVVSLNIANYNVCCILVDNESSINILFYDIFSKVGIFLDQMGWLDSLLVGSIENAIPIEGVITLPVTVEQAPRQSIL